MLTEIEFHGDNKPCLKNGLTCPERLGHNSGDSEPFSPYGIRPFDCIGSVGHHVSPDPEAPIEDDWMQRKEHNRWADAPHQLVRS